MATQNTLSIPPDLMTKIETAASAVNQTAAQWAAEALQRQLVELSSSRLQKLFSYGEQRAKEQGIRESDINRLIAEDRKEQRGR